MTKTTSEIESAAQKAVADLLKQHEQRWRYAAIREAGMNAAKIAHHISPEAGKAICAVFGRAYQMGEFMWADAVFGDGTPPAWINEPVVLRGYVGSGDGH